MSLQYLKKELSHEVEVDVSVLIIMNVDSIIFDGFCQACPEYPGKFVLSL